MEIKRKVAEQHGRIALVTGASKGIGAAIARRLAREGFTLWLNYHRDHAAAQGVQAEIQEAGGQCQLLPFDVADPQQCQQALMSVMARCGAPEILVNNAGFACDNLLALMPPEEWNRVLAVHLGGFYNVTSPVAAAMLRRKRGGIINIASTSGQTGVAGQVNYSAAKAGLIGATRSLAVELGRRQIRVNAVAPGYIATEMIAGLSPESVTASIPLQRIGQPHEVASVVSFLSSEESGYITGQVIGVNGGLFTG